DVRVPRRQHHAMVQFVGDGFGEMLESDEIENVIILIQGPLDLNGGPVVMAMKALTFIAFIADEVARTEDQMVLGDADLETLHHIPHAHDHGNLGGRVIVPRRKATYKQAATRSAVVPGLRALPSARSQASSSARARQPARARGQPASSTFRDRLMASSPSAVPRFRTIRL